MYQVNAKVLRERMGQWLGWFAKAPSLTRLKRAKS